MINQTMHNDTVVAEPEHRPPFLIAILMFISICIVFTNGSIIILYAVNVRVRRITNIFVLNLCIADFQQGLISLPLTTFYPRGYLNEPEHHGLSMGWCVFISNYPSVITSVALVSLTLVSIDRLIAVKYPLSYSQRVPIRCCVLIIIAVWLSMALINFSTSLGIRSLTEENVLYRCNGGYYYDTPFYAMFCIVCILIPLLIVFFTYMWLYGIARRHHKSIEQLQVLSAEAKKRNKYTKAAKTTFFMTVLYSALWVPFLFAIGIGTMCTLEICRGIDRNGISNMVIPTAFLAYMSSIANPIIYVLRNPGLKRKFLCCRMFNSQVTPLSAQDSSMTQAPPIEVDVGCGNCSTELQTSSKRNHLQIYSVHSEMNYDSNIRKDSDF